jgi:hypothetical protein
VLSLFGAGVLSALCLWFSWRAFRRCHAIESSVEGSESDVLEQSLLERERNIELNLAERNVRALGRVALFGGTGLGIAALTGGHEYDFLAGAAFGLGLFGWAGCGELRRRIGSLADSWRTATNRRRRRQGVDQSERTG